MVYVTMPLDLVESGHFARCWCMDHCLEASDAAAVTCPAVADASVRPHQVVALRNPVPRQGAGEPRRRGTGETRRQTPSKGMFGAAAATAREQAGKALAALGSKMGSLADAVCAGGAAVGGRRGERLHSTTQFSSHITSDNL